MGLQDSLLKKVKGKASKVKEKNKCLDVYVLFCFVCCFFFCLTGAVRLMLSGRFWGGGMRKLHIPYIRLFTLHALSANSSLKPCIKSTQVNFSRNPSESFKIYFICKNVSNLRD